MRDNLSIKFRAWQGGRFHYWGFIKSKYGEDYEFHSLADTNVEPLSMTEKMARSQQYTGLKDKNGKESAHFDIANDKYLLYLDLVYGLYLIDISNGAIIKYKEGIIDEITGNYFEQHEKISEDCQRSIDQLISQASGTM
ncbi:hypothetical protein LCGC14_0387400 [marine sediment metagenome]|uniref:YopX protein domain-containing protein n=1 Tax=marine sediment metagenome TaxID=412755 RepID=A0A0F9W9D0_9ZZZZ